MITIKDIARESGYSLATVSRALNGSGRVSEKARSNIMDVVEKYNFKLNENAKFLKQQSSRCIAIILKGAQNMLFASITKRLQSGIEGNGYESVLVYLDEDDDEVRCAHSLCRERKPEGLLFLGGNLELFREEFEGINIPCVLVTIEGSDLGFDNISSVATDDREAADHLVSRLIEMGHRRIGIIGGHPKYSAASHCRYEGALRAFERNGIQFDPYIQYKVGHFSLEDGYSAAAKLIRNMPDVTAVFAMSDIMAIGAMRAAADRGIRVPEDLSVAGYDGIEIVDYVNPRLTTIRQNREEIASRSVSILVSMIRGECSAAHEIVPFTMINGNSVRNISPEPDTAESERKEGHIN